MEIKAKSKKVLDLEPHISARAKLWRASQIRSFFPLEHTPGVVSLLAGKPNPETFPFEAITLSVKSLLPDDGAYDIRIDGSDLDRALQYGMTGGLPDFVEWLEGFQTHVHGNSKEEEGWQVVVGNGSQDLLTKAFQILVDEGDSLLVETPCFPCAEGYFNLLPTQKDVDTLNATGLPTPPASEIVSVRTDGGGLDAGYLRDILEAWPTTHPKKKKPVVLYTVPVGSNPIGTTISEKRKAEVLRLAKEHDFLIFEDDAYAYLYYGDAPKPRSYFAMEAEVNGEVGRVIRFDSFSKILSSGMRLGFVTAPKRVCELIVLNTANVNLQCSSTTQMMALKLLSTWGHEGLVRHCEKVAGFYKTKRDMFERAAQKHLKGVATWTTPVAGMFLFIELSPLPDGTKLDSYTFIKERAFKGGVLCVPGGAFMPLGMTSSFIRASFSLADEQTANEAFRRLRVCIDDLRAEHA